MMAFFLMSMNVQFLAGSRQARVNRCLCMLSDLTLDLRKPLETQCFGGSRIGDDRQMYVTRGGI